MQDAVSLNMLLLKRLIEPLEHCITSTHYQGYIFLLSFLMLIACAPIFVIYSWVTQGTGPIQVRYADGERERLGTL